MSDAIKRFKERRENRLIDRANRGDDEEFESKHPRGHGGKFAKKGSGNSPDNEAISTREFTDRGRKESDVGSLMHGGGVEEAERKSRGKISGNSINAENTRGNNIPDVEHGLGVLNASAKSNKQGNGSLKESGDAPNNGTKREKRSRIQTPLRNAIRKGDTQAISSLLDKMKPEESIVDPIDPQRGIYNTFVKNKDGSFTWNSQNLRPGERGSSSLSSADFAKMLGSDSGIFTPKYEVRGRHETSALQREKTK